MAAPPKVVRPFHKQKHVGLRGGDRHEFSFEFERLADDG
jgi:hypothetical protein